ncbi:NADH dehydrogenase [Anoxybacter fermentans]|uniref:NADH dehydrogenase n=1 Tax=Anoxybacter fermentans TaxID=1323375 RepID=A0A3Q9HQU3_9FIRM|nr:(2Fe-2S) ferredoxin domain-containing protein [Anoxybacter fermentans]AZR73535.1 NADH dehydrogenase [Anoxybacter fermentans]
MKSLNELNELKKKAQEYMNLREGKEIARVTVAMGTCGIAAGAREVLTAVMDEIKKRNLQQITVTQTSCPGRCSEEPIVIVEMDGQKVMYGKMDAEKARKMVVQHLVNKTICSEWVI